MELGFVIPIIFFVSAVAGFIIGVKFSKSLLHLQNRIRRKEKIKYRIHHDLVGLLLILLSLFSPVASLGVALSGLGFGLFIQHVTTTGFKFITKT